MNKGNSNTQPKRLKKLGNYWQVRWNIVRNDRTDEDGNTYESWDYEYANCENPYRDGIIEGIIRSKYTKDQVEAILLNAYDRKDMLGYLKFQAWRKTAKEIADDKDVTTKQKIQMKMPLSFVLTGSKYEILADRVMKMGFPYEITVENDVEVVTTWFNTVLPEHQNVIGDDPDVETTQIDLN
jgi:hypothetical protein